MKPVLLDTGVLAALRDRSENFHQRGGGAASLEAHVQRETMQVARK